MRELHRNETVPSCRQRDFPAEPRTLPWSDRAKCQAQASDVLHLPAVPAVQESRYGVSGVNLRVSGSESGGNGLLQWRFAHR